MKIVIIISMCLFFFLKETEAQRRLPNQKGLQLIAGFGDGYGFSKSKNLSYYTSVGLSGYTKNSHKWLYGIEYFEKQYCYKCRSIPASQFVAEGGYFYNFLSNRGKDVFFSIGLSGLAGYETVNWGDKIFPDGATLKEKDKFIGGAALTFELETYVTDWLIVLVNIRERCLNSNVGKFHTQIGIGLKYIYK